MPAPDALPLFGVLAYGPAPGLELIPYFLGLLAWVGLALSAFLLAPITALIRRLRRARGAVPPEPKNEPAAQFPGLVMDIGDSKETTAPQGSATAGSTWIQFAVTYLNRSKKSVWIDGYSPDNVFYELETRSAEHDEWAAYGMGYCGTGVTRHEICPGESHNFTIALPDRYRGAEFRVLLDYYADASQQASTRAESPPQKVLVR